MGPTEIIAKMKAILSHIGAWAPMAEQKAVARFLSNTEAIDRYLTHFKNEVEERLTKIYQGFVQLKKEGFNIDAVAPEAAIYLTIKLDLAGKKQQNGNLLSNQSEVTSYILQHAGLAVVPFYAFGAESNSPWYRLSVGTCKKEEIDEIIARLKKALQQLS
jgi:aspartate aminotransferase